MNVSIEKAKNGFIVTFYGSESDEADLPVIFDTLEEAIDHVKEIFQ